MKNNNPLNNSNVSFFTINKNMVVFGIILVFLIIIGFVMNRNSGNLLDEKTEDISSVIEYTYPIP